MSAWLLGSAFVLVPSTSKIRFDVSHHLQMRAASADSVRKSISLSIALHAKIFMWNGRVQEKSPTVL
jgi:hypothetical protein